MYNQFEKQAVTNLQRYLRQLAYADDTLTQPPIDGIFDTVTRRALTEFQTKNNLSPTGIADRTTWELLFKLYLKSIATHSPSKRPHVFPNNAIGNNLKSGDTSFYVTALQFMLRELSKNYGETLNIEITGLYDANTSAAVKHFQALNALPETSATDKETWDRIVDSYNRHANEYYE